MDGQHLNDGLSKSCWNCFGERLKALKLIRKVDGWKFAWMNGGNAVNTVEISI